jgi:predicted esterase
MIARLALPCVFALSLVPLAARADGTGIARHQGPCAGCVSSLPGGSDPRPLLVLLHGDGESASSMLDAWEHSAKGRGWAVVALACPRSEGCTSGSFWKWNGDPSWVLRQVNSLAELRAIDRDRMWIVGWSGGGSYIGFRTQEFERAFAAIVVHGGGIPPARSICPTSKTAVYFLVGDMNPLHGLAVRLFDHYEACQDEVTWTLVKGADHEGERRALATYREAILDWLSTKRLAAPRVDDDADAPKTIDPPVVAPAASTPPTGAISTPASCRCQFPGVVANVSDRAMLGPSLLTAVALSARRRRRVTDRAPAPR